jgi:RNA ligase (TIGR02306 family)
MKLASIEVVAALEPHNNADNLEIATVLGYKCIVQKNDFFVGDTVVFIQPDSLLPQTQWAEPFLKRGDRVKSMKLRGAWSFGIVLSTHLFEDFRLYPIGAEVSEEIGVTKYQAPQPQDLQAAGYPPVGLPKTDEERYQNLMDILPLDSPVDVTLKIDGSSATYYCFRTSEGSWDVGICSRSLQMKPDCENNYTRIERKYKILSALLDYCTKHNVSLALRGEIYGQGIQDHSANPHGKMPLNFAAYSVWNHDLHRYTTPTDDHYYTKVCDALTIPVVPMLEKQVPLSLTLIEKYSNGIDRIDGKRFEGVVIKHDAGSFKIINLSYDERK